MPKAKKYIRLEGGATKEIKVSRKFRISNRRDGRTAHTQTNDVLSSVTSPKYKANAERVLAGRV